MTTGTDDEIVDPAAAKKQAGRARAAAWYKAHRDEVRAKRRAIRDKKGRPTLAEKFKSREANARFYAKHREEILDRHWERMRRETPEQKAERRERNRDAQRRYRENKRRAADIR